MGLLSDLFFRHCHRLARSSTEVHRSPLPSCFDDLSFHV